MVIACLRLILKYCEDYHEVPGWPFTEWLIESHLLSPGKKIPWAEVEWTILVELQMDLDQVTRRFFWEYAQLLELSKGLSAPREAPECPEA